MDELKPCPFCGSEPNHTPNHTIICNTCHREVLPDVWQTRPIEDALQKRVEELNGEVEKWQDICTLSDDRAIVCIGNERALRTSLNEAVKEIDNMRDFEPEDQIDTEWLHAVMRVLDILRSARQTIAEKDKLIERLVEGWEKLPSYYQETGEYDGEMGYSKDDVDDLMKEIGG